MVHPENEMKVKIRSKVRGIGSEKRQHVSKEAEYCLHSLFFFQILREFCVVLLGQICVRLCQEMVFVSQIVYINPMWDHFVRHYVYFRWYSCMTCPIDAKQWLASILDF